MIDPIPAPAEKIKAVGYAASGPSGSLKRFDFERGAARGNQVEVEVMYCGICHSDIHQVKNEWSNTVYPCLPGHEIVGKVTRIGDQVTQHAVGDVVGIGCMIDSCGTCDSCRSGEQNYCTGPNSWLATYNGPMIPSKKAPGRVNIYGRDNTFGGYSNVVVAREDFVLKIPPSLRPELAAPILCAGVTTYSPLKHWGIGVGHTVGVVGFGGLGDMACKIAKAMGAEVTVFTRNGQKLEEAQRLGVGAVLETDEQALAALESRFDFILSTVPEKHDLNPYVKLLKRDGTACVVGALELLEPINNMPMAFQRKRVAGSLIGNLADTQEVLDFCAAHSIGPDIELIDIEDANDAFAKVEQGDVRFRYVIDMASLEDAD